MIWNSCSAFPRSDGVTVHAADLGNLFLSIASINSCGFQGNLVHFFVLSEARARLAPFHSLVVASASALSWLYFALRQQDKPRTGFEPDFPKPFGLRGTIQSLLRFSEFVPVFYVVVNPAVRHIFDRSVCLFDEVIDQCDQFWMILM